MPLKEYFLHYSICKMTGHFSWATQSLYSMSNVKHNNMNTWHSYSYTSKGKEKEADSKVTHLYHNFIPAKNCILKVHSFIAISCVEMYLDGLLPNIPLSLALGLKSGTLFTKPQ